MRRPTQYIAQPMFYEPLGTMAWDIGYDKLMFEFRYAEHGESQTEAHKNLAHYQQWCRANAKKDWHISFMKTSEVVTEIASYQRGIHDRKLTDTIDVIRVSFEDPRDAVLFKMFTQ